MKKVALAVVILIVLVVGALLILPSFWDWNGEKGRIASLVKAQTGRDLQIAGDVSLRLLPTPAFSAHKVTLANIAGGSSPAMVRLDELQIRIALLPLLSGHVIVESVTLVKPQVLLEVLPDGRVNWNLAAENGSHATTLPEAALRRKSSTASDQSVRVESFNIEGGTLRYLDGRSGREEVLSDLNAELGAESLLGPFVATGSAAYQSVPLKFDIGIGRVVDNGATAVSVSLSLPEANASGQFVGAVSRHQDVNSLRGRLQANGKDLARFLRGLPVGALPVAGPPLLSQPFKLSAEVSASEAEAAAEAVSLSLGPLSLEGKLDAKLGEVPDITAELSTKTADLDALLALPAAGGDGEAAAPAGSAPASGAGRPATPEAAALPSLPKGISATVKLAADALLFRGQTVRQVELAARLENGSLNIKTASAQLPGSSDLSLAGTLSTGDASPHFSGILNADSDNLRGLLRWLGIEVTEVPADRLRRMTLKTGVEADPGQVTLRNADLRLDVSRLTGGVAIALRKRPGLGIGLTLDRINLDAYLPQPGTAAQPAPAPAPAQTQAETATPSGHGVRATAAPPPAGGLPLLGRFDANIDLKIGQMTYRGLPLDGLHLDATLQGGGLVVREASIADLAGSRASFTGSLANVDRNPSFDGSIDVSVAALSRLTKLLGLDNTGPLPLESFSLSGAANGNLEAVRFDQRLTALDGSLHAAGKAELLPAGPRVEAAVDLNHPNLSVLLSELLRDPSIPGGLGPLAVSGKLQAVPSELKLSGLSGKVAGVDLLGGQLGLALSGERPKITADLNTGEVPLAALAAPAAASGGGGGEAPASTAEGTPAPIGRAARDRWSHRPIDLIALRQVDADVKLRAKAIVIDRARLTDAVVEAALDGGVLDLKQFNAGAYGGSLSVTGRADAREAAPDGLQVTAAVNARNVEMKDLLHDFGGTDRFSGPLSLDSTLTTKGGNEAALIGDLNGDGKLAGTVTVATKAEEQAGAALLDLLGKKMKEVRGLADSTTMLFDSFAGEPAKIGGSFTVKQGVVHSDDLKIEGRDAVARTAGDIDLGDWQVDSRTDVFRNEDPKSAYLTATLLGPLDAPNIGLKGKPFQRRQEPAATDAPVPQNGQAPAPQTPEELLKNGLKGLLKGLGE